MIADHALFSLVKETQSRPDFTRLSDYPCPIVEHYGIQCRPELGLNFRWCPWKHDCEADFDLALKHLDPKYHKKLKLPDRQIKEF